MSSPRKRLPNGLFESLKWNFVALGGAGLVSLALMGAIAGNIGYQTLMDAERIHVAETANMAATLLDPFVVQKLVSLRDHTALQKLTSTLKRDSRFRFTLIENDGTVIADSDADARYMENHGQRTEVAAAILGMSDHALRYSHTMGVDTLYFARPWQGMVLRVAVPLRFIAPLYWSLFLVVLVVCSVSILLIALVSWGAYRRISKPIGRILQATRAWEAGESHSPLYLRKPTELAEIGRTLNTMTQHISRQLEEAEVRERELSYLFGAIREAVMVVDQHQIVYGYNASAKHFFAKLNGSPHTISDGDTSSDVPEAIKGTHLIAHIRSSELAEMVSECNRTRIPVTAQVTVYAGDPIQFEAYCSPLEPPDQDTRPESRRFILVLYLA